MATPPTMPAQGEHSAPTFDRTRPRELPRFFSDLDRLFKIHNKLTKTKKKEYVVYYTDFETKQTWSSLKEFSDITKSYLEFKKEMLSHYPDMTGKYVYSIRDMDMLIGEQQHLGFNNMTELSEFHLQFIAITNWLISEDFTLPHVFHSDF